MVARHSSGKRSKAQKKKKKKGKGGSGSPEGRTGSKGQQRLRSYGLGDDPELSASFGSLAAWCAETVVAS